jgi:hypothetical protein
MRHYNRSRRTNLFAQNLLRIGYHGWQGYLEFDRGIIAVSSDVDLLNIDDCDDREVLLAPSLNFRYIPQQRVSLYLEEWLIPTHSAEPILAAVVNYHPQTELVLAIESSVNLDICWCQNLKISPPNC